MKIILIRCACLAGLALGLVCCKEKPAAGGMDDVRAEESMADFSSRTGIAVPVTAILLSAGDGGGRDALTWRRWVVFCDSGLEMPAFRSSNVERYLEIPIGSSVRMIEKLIGQKRIEGAKNAYHSEWKTNGLEFRGTLVNSSHGTYLLVQQFGM